MNVITKKSLEKIQWKMWIGYMKGQGACVRSMNAPIVMWLSGWFINICITNMGFHMKANKFGYPFICFGWPRWQNNQAMNVHILSNPQTNPSWKESNWSNKGKLKLNGINLKLNTTPQKNSTTLYWST